MNDQRPPKPQPRPATRAAQALGRIVPPFGEIVPPIHLSTTYERAADGSFPGPVYSRDGNPTYRQLEALLADLEGGAAALTFSAAVEILASPWRESDGQPSRRMSK